MRSRTTAQGAIPRVQRQPLRRCIRFFRIARALPVSLRLRMARAILTFQRQTAAMSFLPVTVVLLAYLAGCLNAGYYYVRIFHCKDIRLLGTGTAGARNAGRLYGRRIFFLVFLVDFVKGAALTAIGRSIGLEYAALCAVAVVAGHIWPVQLKFQGGKGVASALGCMVLLAPGLLMWVALGCVVLKLSGHTVVRAGLAGFWLAAVVAMRYEPLPVLTAATLLALLLTVSHRHNLHRGT